MMVGEVVRAVGPRRENGGIEARVTRVEHRMDTLEQTLATNREAAAAESRVTHGLLERMLKAMGEPANGPGQPSSGLYYAVEAVGDRVKPFERMREWAKGAAAAAAFFALPAGAIIWALTGAKVTAFFHS